MPRISDQAWDAYRERWRSSINPGDAWRPWPAHIEKLVLVPPEKAPKPEDPPRMCTECGEVIERPVLAQTYHEVCRKKAEERRRKSRFDECPTCKGPKTPRSKQCGRCLRKKAPKNHPFRKYPNRMAKTSEAV